MATELLRLRCRGHRDIRATHAKTLEFSADDAITGRATCVIGVDTAVVGAPPVGLAGWLRITVTAGGVSATVRALANSRWRPGGSGVVRRSGLRLPNTLATDADLAAADLPRELVAAMADPDAAVEVLITRDDRDEDRLIRYRAGQDHDDRLAAECAAADVVLAEDSAARAIATAHGAVLGSREDLTGRVLTVSTVDGTSSAVRALLATRPAVEALNLPSELAVAAAAPHAAPLLIATGLPRKDVQRLATTHAASRVVFDCPAGELPRRLSELARAVGTSSASVLRVGDERPVWGPLTDIAETVSSGDVLCALDPVQSSADSSAPEVAPSALLSALLAQEVSATTLVRALAEQPGWSRKQAYDFVLGLSRKG
ncbi:DUF371 domain-containing protein [Actinokineospora sp. NBRC 105648]|uniref:DUF371 domain-containing protein n=1 Tax=Actinokineospora sp. NBRC 105648 TaxID=3032206 RepID=UPI0024A163CF|nr:DUF371 domain-containing protein [Actinokineospora sp. NBRC 105648]GLZ37804.1 hypothetical protein Acsp05_14290 [Actinokineospora sp. NBRC 105648]